jgi:hypothetical protein
MRVFSSSRLVIPFTKSNWRLNIETKQSYKLMTGVSQITVAESAENLRALMKKQKTALSYAKLQALYLIKIQAAETIRYLAVMMGRSESTIYYWLGLYRKGGLSL